MRRRGWGGRGLGGKYRAIMAGKHWMSMGGKYWAIMGGKYSAINDRARLRRFA
ncbi:MAG: hypothetical protein R6V73_00655 [Anaerolineales bacterium]